MVPEEGAAPGAVVSSFILPPHTGTNQHTKALLLSFL